MARGPRKSIDEKIAEKESQINALKVRLKSEQAELDAMYKEKGDMELKEISEMIKATNLSAQEVLSLLKEKTAS